MGYILHLLGMKKLWSTAKTCLFREPFAFIKFLREVDPLSIPIRRVCKANKHFESTRNILASSIDIYESNTSKASPVQTIRKLYRWVVAFRTIANIIIKADMAKKERLKKQCMDNRVVGASGPVIPSNILGGGLFDNSVDDVLSVFAEMLEVLMLSIDRELKFIFCF